MIVEGKFYRKVSKELIRCEICQFDTAAGQSCLCGNRINDGSGRMVVLNFGMLSTLKLLSSTVFSPILQSDKVLGVGQVGTNIRSTFDPFWSSSHLPVWMRDQVGREETNRFVELFGISFSPDKLVEYAKNHGVDTLLFNYSEPLVNWEYTHRVAQIAVKTDIKTVLVSDLCVTPQFISGLDLSDIHAVVVKFHSCNHKFPLKHLKFKLREQLAAIERLRSMEVELLFATTLIPGENLFSGELKLLADQISQFGVNRWILQKFYPDFRIQDKLPTSDDQLKLAQDIGTSAGLQVFLADSQFQRLELEA